MKVLCRSAIVFLLLISQAIAVAQEESPQNVSAPPSEEETAAIDSVDEKSVEDSLVVGPHPSFIFISAIKSIAGKEPSSEFIDINCKFNLVSKSFALVSMDLAFSTTQVDTLQETEKTLTEAGLSLNYEFANSIDSLRTFILGLSMKIFDGIPFAGIQLGSIETHKKSPVFTSFCLGGYLLRLNSIDEEINRTQDVKDSYHNFYVEFALHSNNLDFLKHLRIKGGILLPISNWKVNGFESRIVLEVPIGKKAKF